MEGTWAGPTNLAHFRISPLFLGIFYWKPQVLKNCQVLDLSYPAWRDQTQLATYVFIRVRYGYAK